MTSVPEIRIRPANDAPLRPRGEWVLYWMIAARRASWNFALDRALEHARALAQPLVVLEPLGLGHRWASARFHRFVLDGMADNVRAFDGTPICYVPWVETEAGGGRGLVEALAKRAAVVVTDDFPCFFLPKMIAAAASRLDVRVEQVDGNGILPMAAADAVFPTAHAFRRFLQKNLRPHLGIRPSARLDLSAVPPLDRLPRAISSRWPAAGESLLRGGASAVAKLPVDPSVGVVDERGGSEAARAALRRFVREKLDRYDEDRNDPDADGASGLSPWLHFGHLSSHEVLDAVARHHRWSAQSISDRTSGSREGWWGMPAGSEAFLDQLVTWRELGFNFCSKRSDFDRYESLPAWAQATLAKHAGDRRPETYSRGELERAATGDPVWNAAQTELVRTGRMNNYLRMLWGKKILEWSRSPKDALETMIELNNRWALDGRDPNSYSGIFWCLGRYDRAWGPERAIFGTIRYMSSANTIRKLRLRAYLARFSTTGGEGRAS